MMVDLEELRSNLFRNNPKGLTLKIPQSRYSYLIRLRRALVATAVKSVFNESW